MKLEISSTDFLKIMPDNVGKYSTVGQTADGKMAHAHCLPDN